jgi:hypothetical protein
MENTATVSSDQTAGFVLALIGFIFLSCFFYFLPAIIGRNKRNAAGIFVCNLLFGWTLLGWGVSLIWALCGETPHDYERRYQYPYPPQPQPYYHGDYYQPSQHYYSDYPPRYSHADLNAGRSHLGYAFLLVVLLLLTLALVVGTGYLAYLAGNK